LLGPAYKAVLVLPAINFPEVPGCPGLSQESVNALYFYFNVHTSRQIETHQHINRLGVGIDHVYQTVVGTNFKMLV
jgi:hypothetical protein